MLRYSPDQDPFGKIIEQISLSGLGIVDITTQKSDLEDVFLDLTRRPDV